MNKAITTDQLLKEYNTIKTGLYDYIFNSDTGREFSSLKSDMFTVTDESTNQTIEICASNLLFSVVALKCLVDVEIVPELSDFFVGDKIDAEELERYFNRLITLFYEMGENLHQLSLSIADSLAELSKIAADTNMQRGNTICLYDIINEANNSTEFNDLINTVIPDGLQFNEIEEFVSTRKDRIMEYLSKADTCLKSLVNCKGAINANQLGQSIVNIGLKPSIEGAIIPEPVNTSFMRGLRNRNDFFVDAQGGRKSLIVNYTNVRSSGYLTRKLSLLVMDHYSASVDKCNTKHFLDVFIENDAVLKRIHNRMDSEGNYITYDMKELIGKTIKLRSPITCSARHGSTGYEGVCNACYGRLAEPNKNFHWGIIAVLFLTSKLIQNLLSSKHLLQTKSEKINWSDEFLSIFSVDKADVFNDVEIKNITFLKEDVYEDDDGDLYLNKFTVNGTTIESPKELFINESFIEEYKNTATTSVVMTGIPHDSRIFSIKMSNIEISASLRKILQLVGSNEHLGLENDINAVYNEFISLLNQSKMSVQSVHIEMILRALVRDSSDITKFPDFTKTNYPEIALLGVAKAIFNAPMLSVSMSYEHHGRQLVDPTTYRKSRTSIFDNLYK